MIVFSSLEFYNFTGTNSVYIGKPLSENYEKSLENLSLILDKKIRCVCDPLFSLCINLISSCYTKSQELDRNIIEYCGFDFVEVQTWQISPYRSEDQEFLLRFFALPSIFEGFYEIVKLFATTDGNIESFVNKSKPLLKLCKKYVKISPKYLVVDDTLIISATINDIFFISDIRLPDNVINENYIDYMSSIFYVKSYFENNYSCEDLVICSKELEIIKTVKQSKIVCYAMKGTDFGYQTIIENKTIISLNIIRGVCDQINVEEKNNYCFYETRRNRVFGVTSFCAKFDYEVNETNVSSMQEFYKINNEIWFKIFNAKNVTFWAKMDSKPRIKYTSKNSLFLIEDLSELLESVENPSKTSDYEEEDDLQEMLQQTQDYLLI